MNLFETHSAILDQFPKFENSDDMLDFLEMKLKQKGFGNIVHVVECKADTGTHNTPIFSGVFKLDKGFARVKCTYRQPKKKQAHWAVYCTAK